MSPPASGPEPMRPATAPSLNPVRSASEFFRGVGDVWRGFAFLIGHPSLWLWALIPFLLNVALLGGLAWLGWHVVAPYIEHWFINDHGFWMNLLGWLAERPLPGGLRVADLGWFVDLFFWVVTVLVFSFIFVPLAALIAAPFNDFLSEKVERLYGGHCVNERFSMRTLARGIAVSLRNCFKLSLLTLTLLALALPLHLIPGVGSLLATAFSMAVTIRFVVLEYTSYSMDRRFYTFERQRDFLRRNRPRTIGLGVMAFVMIMSAVAGTLLFCDTELNAR